MDISQIHTLSPQYFFQESTYQNKLLLDPYELDDSIFWKDILNENGSDLILNEQKNDQMMMVDPQNNIIFLQEIQIKREDRYQDQFQGFLDYQIQNINERIYERIDKPLQQDLSQDNPNIEAQEQVDTINQSPKFNSNIKEEQLENIIAYLVQYSNSSLIETQQNIAILFPQSSKQNVVNTLIQKFSKLKKTKQQLVKYCMRKAFKFILELPKNNHFLSSQKQQKYSFSKCKTKYLKNISQQKSMNNTFLKQIFSQKDFVLDYQIFLQHFQDIMIHDNQKKVKNLASLLTQQKQGLYKKAQLVKRLPWTKSILQKVLKISQDLLKFSQG